MTTLPLQTHDVYTLPDVRSSFVLSVDGSGDGFQQGRGGGCPSGGLVGGLGRYKDLGYGYGSGILGLGDGTGSGSGYGFGFGYQPEVDAIDTYTLTPSPRFRKTPLL